MNSSAVSAKLDIEAGTLIIDGNVVSTISSYAGSSMITAYNGLGRLRVDYNVRNTSKTTVTASITPEPAYNPNPSHNAVGVNPATNLTWTAGSGTVSHDVYLGTNLSEVTNAADPNTLPGRGNQTATTYNPSADLDANTTYYWRIDERNTYGATKGDIWSFTTEEIKNYVLQNDVYGIELLPDLTMRVTNKAASVSADFVPKFTVIYSSSRPTLSSGELTAEWPTGRNPFLTGTNYTVQASASQVVDGNLVLTFPEQTYFTLTAYLGFSSDYDEPVLTYALVSKSAGWFMTAYTGAPQTNPATMEIIPQPATWSDNVPGPPDGPAPAFPSEPKFTQESLSTISMVMTRNNGLTCALVVNPDYVTFRMPQRYNTEFGLCIRNPSGNAQPIILAPEMGIRNRICLWIKIHIWLSEIPLTSACSGSLIINNGRKHIAI